MKKILLFASLEVMAYSCMEEEELRWAEQEPTATQPLEIVTKSLTPPSLNLSQAFAEATELGVFVYSTDTKEVYKQKKEYENVKATAVREKEEIRWRKEPEIWLDAEPATILAYAPYQPETSPDARQIPVRIARDAAQTPSYMYGMPTPGHKKITHLSPIVWLNMKYALSRVVFCLAREKQVSGPCVVSRIGIGPQAGERSGCNEGRLDLTTGEIAVQPSTHPFTQLQLTQAARLTTTFRPFPEIKVFPTLRKINTHEIEAFFTIDGTTYAFLFPENSQWKKGYTYTYQLVFTGNSLRCERITITDWVP